jgi:hypothetical protein
MNALLTFKGNYIEFCDFVFDSKSFESGNPYNCTFELKVKSGDFMGVSSCESDMRMMIDFVNELREMYEFRKKEIDFQEIDYGGTLHFSSDALGHISISGQIYGTFLEHELKFIFPADQTALLPFISELQQLVDNQ